MAVSYFASRPISIGLHTYGAGDVVDTSGWSQAYLSTALRLGWIQGLSQAAVTYVTTGAGSSGGGTGGTGGGGTGGGPGVAQAFKGEWTAQAYALDDLVTRNKALYVAIKDSTPDDDPAFVGAPVDIGGVGPNSAADAGIPGAWTGSVGNTYTRFDTTAACQVSHIKLWSAPGSTIPGPVTAGIYNTDRTTKLIQGVSTEVNVAGQLVIAMDDVLSLPPGQYNMWYTNGHHMAIQYRNSTSFDGIVTAVPDTNSLYTDDYGYMQDVNSFRLWSPPASDSAWVRLVRGV